jgi:transposase
MFTVTIAVDLAKNVFEIAVAGRAGTIKERKRLSRPQFEEFWGTRAPCRVVMEACATSHFWARYLIARGFEVTLLPPHYVKPYRRRSKTDRSDCEALLEAVRCAGIHPVADEERRPAGARGASPRALPVDRQPHRSHQHACARCCASSASPFRWAPSAS